MTLKSLIEELFSKDVSEEYYGKHSQAELSSFRHEIIDEFMKKAYEQGFKDGIKCEKDGIGWQGTKQ